MRRLPVLLAVFAASCGSPEIKERNAEIEEAIGAYYRALAAGDGAAACAAMTEEARVDVVQRAQRSGVRSCEEVFERGASYFEGIAVKDVDGLDVDGGTATARVNFGRRFEVQDVRLERVSGRWRVASAEAAG